MSRLEWVQQINLLVWKITSQLAIMSQSIWGTMQTLKNDALWGSVDLELPQWVYEHSWILFLGECCQTSFPLEFDLCGRSKFTTLTPMGPQLKQLGWLHISAVVLAHTSGLQVTDVLFVENEHTLYTAVWATILISEHINLSWLLKRKTNLVQHGGNRFQSNLRDTEVFYKGGKSITFQVTFLQAIAELSCRQWYRSMISLLEGKGESRPGKKYHCWHINTTTVARLLDEVG